MSSGHDCGVCASYSDQSLKGEELDELTSFIEGLLSIRSEYTGIIGDSSDFGEGQVYVEHFHEKHEFLNDIAKIGEELDNEYLDRISIDAGKGYNSSRQLERVIRHSDRISQTDGQSLKKEIEPEQEYKIDEHLTDFEDNPFSHTFLRYENDEDTYEIDEEVEKAAENIFGLT